MGKYIWKRWEGKKTRNVWSGRSLPYLRFDAMCPIPYCHEMLWNKQQLNVTLFWIRGMERIKWNFVDCLSKWFIVISVNLSQSAALAAQHQHGALVGRLLYEDACGFNLEFYVQDSLKLLGWVGSRIELRVCTIFRKSFLHYSFSCLCSSSSVKLTHFT